MLVNGGFRSFDAVDDERWQVSGSSMWPTRDNKRTQTALGAWRLARAGLALSVRLREQIKLGDRVHAPPPFNPKIRSISETGIIAAPNPVMALIRPAATWRYTQARCFPTFPANSSKEYAILSTCLLVRIVADTRRELRHVVRHETIRNQSQDSLRIHPFDPSVKLHF